VFGERIGKGQLPYRGFKTITIKENLHDNLESLWKEDKKKPADQSFSSYVSNMLASTIEYYTDMRRYGPFLELKYSDESMISLYDYRINEPVTVHLDTKRKVLRCDKDKRTDCLHVGFCFAIPEVFRVLVQHGFKKRNF
jgi:hypothetical protein